MGALMTIQDILDSLKGRVRYIDIQLCGYDTSDPDFEDTYSEGRCDQLWDERDYIFSLIRKIEKPEEVA